MKKEKPKKVGRPPTGRAMGYQLNVRIDDPLRKAIEGYREKYRNDAELSELSDAVRHMLKKVARQEGLLE